MQMSGAARASRKCACDLIVTKVQDGVRLWFGDRILPVDEAVIMTWRRLAADGHRTGYPPHSPTH
jgi:hypothetical protein